MQKEGGDPMISVTKEFSFDCAHMLTGHQGLCKNLHGHTYKLQVEVTSFGGVLKDGPSKGMIVDFKDLKQLVKELIVDRFDHSYVCWIRGGDLECSIGALLKEHGRKVTEVDYRPTAENMAQHFYDLLSDAIKETLPGARLKAVRVWETPTSYAEVRV